MLMAADSGIPNSLMIPNSVETLDESSSSPISSIGVASDISLSSPNRIKGLLMAADSGIIIPSSVETLDVSSSSSQIASINADVVSPNRIKGLSSDTMLMSDSVETLDDSSSSSQIASINADVVSPNPIRCLSDSGVSSLSHSSMIIPNSVETLDDDSSSSQIASINADVVQSLAISSPNRDSDSIEATDGSSSSSSSLETQYIPSRLSLEEGECNNNNDNTQIIPIENRLPQIPDEINNSLWNVVDSSSYPPPPPPPMNRHKRWNFNEFSDDDDDDDKLLRPLQQQEPWKMIEEEPTCVGAGLWNLGNTCFINSVLQCFTHTVPLLQCLRSYKFKLPCNCENDFCVIRALTLHIENALRPLRFPISPLYFLHNLNYFSPYFQRYQQEDAHEFLQAFLDKLEKCCINRRSNPDEDRDVNIVDHVFTGRLVSGLRCCNCNSVSETFESSLGLSLEIEDIDNLWSALESFTSVEKLEEQLTCDNCNEKVSKEKQLLLDKLPLVATFHLKRFKNNGFFMEKIFKHVEIPLEIDLKPYMRSNDVSSTKYYLYAFVEHLGVSLAYGHYSSYVRSAPRVWHHFDDLKVTRVEEEYVLSRDPYILFYAREGTVSFEEMMMFQPLPLLFPSPKSVLESNEEEEDEEEEEGASSPLKEKVVSLSSNEELFLSAKEFSREEEEEEEDDDYDELSELSTSDDDDEDDDDCDDDDCLATNGETFEDLETAKNENREDEEETLSDLMKKASGFGNGGGGGRELLDDEGIDVETGSPSKKLKTE